jgi:hypothetical protein
MSKAQDDKLIKLKIDQLLQAEGEEHKLWDKMIFSICKIRLIRITSINSKPSAKKLKLD